jgi:glycosyltransferase involved in cell wall biosynthesis
MRAAYQGARRAWFVSRHNQELTEFSIGCRLPNASVVRNPTGVELAQCSPLDWPATEPVWRLACVARLAVRDKGQDLLIQALALPHWRERPLHVSICGKGPNAGSLQRLAELLDVRCLHFTGHTESLDAVWRQHHGLILPSRVEGLPLAMVEAMLCGRPVIATRVAGIPEVLEDGASGFLAAAPTVEHLDEAMQRAWGRRHEWQAMGQEAGHHIRRLMPEHPAEVFLDEVRAAAQVR